MKRLDNSDAKQRLVRRISAAVTQIENRWQGLKLNSNHLLSYSDSHNTSSEMSMFAVRSAPFLLSDYCSSIRSVSVCSSLSDMASSSLDLSSSDTLNLEDIKMQLSQCCMTCGVCWKDEHFSFDCAECGSYALIRPCMMCGGTCGALWTRDFALVSVLLLNCAMRESFTINTLLN